MDYQLRPTTEDDRQFALELESVSTTGYSGQLRVLNESSERQALGSDLRIGEDELIIVDGQPAGVIGIADGDKAIWLRFIKLLPEYQVESLETDLIEYTLKVGKLLKKPVKMTILKINPARHLYERLGFEVTGAVGLEFELTAFPREDMTPPTQNGFLAAFRGLTSIFRP